MPNQPPESHTLEILLAVFVVVGSLGGVVLGWLLSVRSARAALAEERKARVHARLVEVVRDLDGALLSISEKIPTSHDGSPVDRLLAARREWTEAWARSTPLGNHPLVERFYVVGNVLRDAVEEIQGEMFPDGGGGAIYVGDGFDSYFLHRAVASARHAAGAFIREEPTPAPSFPLSEEYERLAPRIRAEGGRRDREPLRQWLEEHPAPV